MYLHKILIVSACLHYFVLSAFAGHVAQVRYEKPSHPSEVAIASELKNNGLIEDVVKFINEEIRLTEPLYLVIGGSYGPLYDTSTGEIIIPYKFVEEVQNRFLRANYSETGVSIVDATMDSLMHTVFHELAHALIFTYNLPVLGKEEDAADSLATVLLIEYFDSGAEIAMSAADLFDLESEERDVLVEEDFWDEHSLDSQRFYTTLCHIYGSDPDQYVSLQQDIGISERRAEMCIEEYENISRSWFSLLQPYLKNDA